jgi:hypothetical protein
MGKLALTKRERGKLEGAEQLQERVEIETGSEEDQKSNGAKLRPLSIQIKLSRSLC